MRVMIILALLSFSLTNCNNANQPSAQNSTDTSKVFETTTPNVANDEIYATEILCDTVYENKGYKITLVRFNSTNKNETIPNTLFTLSKLTNGQYIPIYSDSIFSESHGVTFEDFNNDKVTDILVRHTFDVRSNSHYYLYLIDTVQDKLKKIKGFEEIKNPNYLPQYDLIDNYVMSGQIWTSFYKIKGDTLRDYNIVIYDDQTEGGSYDRDYKKAIKSILAIEKGSR